jgi:hypothetical protein
MRTIVDHKLVKGLLSEMVAPIFDLVAEGPMHRNDCVRTIFSLRRLAIRVKCRRLVKISEKNLLNASKSRHA